MAAIEAESTAKGRTPWADAARLGAFGQQVELAAASEAAEAAAQLARSGEAIAALLPVELPPPGQAIDAAAVQLGGLTGFGELDEKIVRAAFADPEGARALLARQARWRQVCSRLQGDVADPAAVSDEAIERLADALAACGEIPETVSRFRERYGAAQALVRTDVRIAGEREKLLQRLDLEDSISAGELLDIAGTLIELDEARVEVKSLFRPALLDELTLLAIAQERASAESLAAERRRLAEQLREPAFEVAPEELERRADTIEHSNIVARLFGGAYRSARRDAARLLTSELPDRAEAATLLRRLARNIRQHDGFRRDSSAAPLFPAPLWRGVSSDWDALTSAAALLGAASNRLSGGRRSAAFDQWLSLPQRDRGSVVVAARAVAPHLDEAVRLGFANVPISHLNQRLLNEERELAALDAALRDVRVKDEGAIVRESETLPARLEALRSSAGDFAKLASSPAFAWVGDIAEPLDRLARALTRCDDIGALTGPLHLYDALRTSETPAADLDAVISCSHAYVCATTQWHQAAGRLEDKAGIRIARLHPSNGDWNDLAAILTGMAEDEDGARLAASLLSYRKALVEVGCEALGTQALQGVVAGAILPDLYELALVRTLLEQFLGGDGEELGRLGSLTLESARAAFVRIDKALQELEAKAIVAKRLQDRAPKGNDTGPRGTWTELSLLNNELSLKRPRTPIRDVAARAGAALQVLKPVWMMSPTSAAQYIQPGSLHFDLLVVDEASQMRPEFAVSAIMRGGQFVVVGDANQLPPTDFFSTTAEEDDAETADGQEGEKMKVDAESILDLANARFQYRRRLKWHYRSQHESLIQFSNRQFYARDLIVFPSPTTDDELLGVKHHYVGGRYDASVNEDEAKAVIEEAFGLMRTYPERSIGIATMNAKQTELIRNEFDRLILEAPEVRRYVDSYAGSIDEFFIKNLENVQGDERDIILISTVYGPDKNGTVMQRFGPMNREVGWRRLNVLVTRAKLSTRLFTSLRPDDIKVTPTSSKGLIAFKAYLNYARNGAQYEDASGGEPDSDFELFVADAIRGAGYEVVPQVGVEGFRIDIGVRHPDFPVGFVAGVECDGAAYHSGMTVRDRDRIRQTVLEQMGWNIYRVWSTDWFADPARETAKLLTKLDLWRRVLAEEFASRPETSPEKVEALDSAGEAGDPQPETIAPAPAAELVAKSEKATPAQSEMPVEAAAEATEPVGRPMRPLDGIDWYEVRKGHLYQIWLDHRPAGQVEVLSRATAAPQVYGDRLRVARSEYEGLVEATGHRFKTHDIHAAVREVARLAAL